MLSFCGVVGTQLLVDSVNVYEGHIEWPKCKFVFFIIKIVEKQHKINKNR